MTKKELGTKVIGVILAASTVMSSVCAPVFAAETDTTSAAAVETTAAEEGTAAPEEETSIKEEQQQNAESPAGESEAEKTESPAGDSETQEKPAGPEEKPAAEEAVADEGKAAETEEAGPADKDVKEDTASAEEASGSEEEIVVQTEDVAVEKGREAAEAAVASGKCGKNAKWTITGSGNNLTLTISGTGATDNYNYDYEDPKKFVEAPWEKAGYGEKIKTIVVKEGITKIGNWSFYAVEASKITLPGTLTEIGAHSFQETLVSGISMPSKVTKIGEGAFINGSIKKIVIPASVKTLGSDAFLYCYKLESVEIKKGNLKVIEDGCFEGCDSLKTVILPEGITKIMDDAFLGCEKLKTLTIPKTVTFIDSSAFDEGINLRCAGTIEAFKKAVENGSVFEKKADVIREVKCPFVCSYSFNNNIFFTLSKEEFEYTGKAIKPSVKVTANNGAVTLKEGTDYTVSYKNNVNIGVATVTVTGKGKYSGSGTTGFAIKKKNDITIGNKVYSYSAKARQINLYAKSSSGEPVLYSCDQALSDKGIYLYSAGQLYIPAKYSGTFTVTAEVCGNNVYSHNSKKITITIPKAAAISSISSKNPAKISVAWKAVPSITGYQIQCSAKSDFSQPKLVTVSNAKQTSSTFGVLKKGAKYYVRMRTYKAVGDKKYYSAWSAAKTVTTKK